jgi:hypothetical protein
MARVVLPFALAGLASLASPLTLILVFVSVNVVVDIGIAVYVDIDIAAVPV